MLKIITNQDSYFKWIEKKSGETSINLSIEIANLIDHSIKPNQSKRIEFTLFKEDFYKALGILSYYLPLYTSTSKSASLEQYSNELFCGYIEKINTFFGNDIKKKYSVNLLYKEDGRFYLNDLSYKGFNIRHFLISYYSVLSFEKISGELIIRLKTGPIKNLVSEMTSEEREEAFFDYIATKKNGNTVTNYKKAATDYSNINAGKPIQNNIDKIGYVGHLLDITDISIIEKLYDSVLKDNDNRIWNQTCSSTVKCYKEFLLSLYFHPNKSLSHNSNVNCTLQQIIYGSPGTGKSHLIKAQTKDKSVIRTTFHPDSDYSTFVGAYKPSTAEQVKYGLQGQPILGNDGKPLKEQIITYKFVQQAFVKAYIAAWRNYPKPEYLVIEEINRGNCAQIFGDLFQLLDRNDEGFSEYSIAADEDLRKELKEQLENSDSEIKASYQKVFNGEELLLPNNLYIWATMNTSDQSLFPIDSAFKRRWEWKYVPICNANKGYYISVNGKKYDWWNFLEAINKKIEETTSSEDKKMGYFFCKAKDDGCISADTFVGKVLFYIWNDVFKDYGFDDAIFKDAEGRVLKFQQFFKTDGSANEDMVELFLNNLKLSPVSDTASGDAKTTAAEEEDLSSEQ